MLASFLFLFLFLGHENPSYTVHFELEPNNKGLIFFAIIKYIVIIVRKRNELGVNIMYWTPLFENDVPVAYFCS